MDRAQRGGAESRGKPCGVCGAADFFKQWASNPFSSSGWGLLLSYCQSAMSYSGTRTQQCSYSVLRKKNKTRSALLSAQSVVVGEGTNWWTWQLIQDQSSVLMHSRRTHQGRRFQNIGPLTHVLFSIWKALDGHMVKKLMPDFPCAFRHSLEFFFTTCRTFPMINPKASI